MTNRRDMIDEALLRPGRLEVQVEISLPDEEGRFQILNIHTSRMRDYGKIESDVDNKVKLLLHLHLQMFNFYIFLGASNSNKKFFWSRNRRFGEGSSINGNESVNKSFK